MKQLFAFSFLISALLISCKNDPCEGIRCENGGFCLEGICYCSDRFTGNNCEIQLKEPDTCSNIQECLFGQFIVYDQNCWPQGNAVYFSNVAKYDNSVDTVSNYNMSIYNLGDSKQTVFAVWDSNLTISIPFQYIGTASFNGEGIIDTSNGEYKIAFQYAMSGRPVCNTIYTQQ